MSNNIMQALGLGQESLDILSKAYSTAKPVLAEHSKNKIAEDLLTKLGPLSQSVLKYGGKIPYARLVMAAILGGRFTADFEEAFANGEVVILGRETLARNLPRAFAKLQRVTLDGTDSDLKLLNAKYAVFASKTLTKKVKDLWTKKLEPMKHLTVFESAPAMEEHWINSLNVTQEHLQAFFYLTCGNVGEEDPNLIRIRFDEYVSLQVRIAPREGDGYAELFEIAINGKTLKYNSVINGQYDALDAYRGGDGKNGFKSLALILFDAFCGGNCRGKAIAGRLAKLTGIYADVSSGEIFDDRTQAFLDGKVAVLRSVATDNFGFHLIDGNQKSVAGAVKTALAIELPAVMHKQGKWLTIGNGALALGVGLVGDELIMLPDNGGKAAKTLDRIKMFKPSADVKGLTESQLRMVLANGKKVAGKGLLLSMAYANCRLVTNGSGNGVLHPDYSFEINGQRTVKATIQLEIGISAQEAIAFCQENVKFFEGTGCVGDALIRFNGRVLALFDEFGCTFTVEKTEFVIEDAQKPHAVTAVIEVKRSHVSFSEKLVADGIKARCSRDELVVTHEGKVVRQADLTLSAEELKAGQALILMWAHARGGLDYNPNVGLSDAEYEEFRAWVKANTRIETIRRAVNDSAYFLIKGMSADDQAFKFFDGNVIEWTGPVLRGEAVLAVEYSTTFQAVGKSDLYPELLHSLMLRNKNFSFLWHMPTAVELRAAQFGLQDMLANESSTGEDVPVIDLKVDCILSEKQLYARKRNADTGEMELERFHKGEQFVTALAKKFPYGFYAKYDKLIRFVDPVALKHLVGNAGMLNSLVEHVVNLVTYAAVPLEKRNKNRINNKIQSCLNLIGSASETNAVAPGILKKGTRVGKMTGRKVCTSYRKGIQAGKVYVNPFDHALLSEEIIIGDVLGISRTPVPFWGALEVVADINTPIGLFEVDPVTWAALTYGDGDGDAINGLILPESIQYDGQEIYPQEMLFDKQDTLSSCGFSIDPATGKMTPMQGVYASIYGNDPIKTPVAKFLLQEKKKDIDTLANFKITRMKIEDYVKVCEDVVHHYQVLVPKSYAVATAALYLAAIHNEMGKTEVVNDLIPVLVFMNAYVHEDKHLGGCNPQAAKFWENMDFLANVGDTANLEIYDQDSNSYKKISGPAAVRYLVDHVLGAANDLPADSLKLTDNQLMLLVKLLRIVQLGEKIERPEQVKDTFDMAAAEPKSEGKLFDVDMELWAKLYKFCRLFGRGNVTRVGKGETLRKTDAVRDGYAVVNKIDIKELIFAAGGNTMMAEMIDHAYRLQNVLINNLRQVEKLEEQGAGMFQGMQF